MAVAIRKHDLELPRIVRRGSGPDAEDRVIDVLWGDPGEKLTLGRNVEIPALEYVEENCPVGAEHLNVEIGMGTGLPTEEEIDGVATRYPPIDTRWRETIVCLGYRHRLPVVVHVAIVPAWSAVRSGHG